MPLSRQTPWSGAEKLVQYQSNRAVPEGAMMKKDAMAALRAHAKKPASEAHGKPASFKKGGPTSEDRMKYGKNLSRAMNQKTG